jgi:hypothetical protein
MSAQNPIRPRFPSDRPLVDKNDRMTPSWDYYFRNVQNQLPPPGQTTAGSTIPITINPHGRTNLEFLVDGTTLLDGELHFPQLTGDVINDGLTTSLTPIGTAVHNQFVKITTDSKGRTVNTTPIVSSDITSLVDNVYVNVSGDTMTGDLKVPSLTLDTTYSSPVISVGQFTWNSTDQTANLQLNSSVSLQLGQESNILILNRTGTTLTDLQAVYITGAQGNRLTADLAIANSDATSAATIGIVTQTIANNQQGFVTTAGLVRQVDTSDWSEGDQLYLSPTIAGGITNIKPVAPEHLVVIGWVVRSHAVNGSIYVNVTNGYELDELHNVLISTPVNGQVLTYESATGLWTNKNSTGGGSGNVDGGASNSVYTASQIVDGGASI